MPRASTGGVVEKTTVRGTSFALRFRALGKRQFLHLGCTADGWTRRRADQELDNVLADVRRGIWQPPPDPQAAPEPREVPTFHEFASEWFAAQKLEGGRNGEGLTPAGAADLQWRLCSHLLPAFAAQRLDQITVEDVDRYRRGKVKEAERRRAAIATASRCAIARRAAPAPAEHDQHQQDADHARGDPRGRGRVRARRAQRRQGPPSAASGAGAAPQLHRPCRPHRRRCSMRPAGSTSQPSAGTGSGGRCWRRWCSPGCGSPRRLR